MASDEGIVIDALWALEKMVTNTASMAAHRSSSAYGIDGSYEMPPTHYDIAMGTVLAMTMMNPPMVALGQAIEKAARQQETIP